VCEHEALRRRPRRNNSACDASHCVHRASPSLLASKHLAERRLSSADPHLHACPSARCPLPAPRSRKPGSGLLEGDAPRSCCEPCTESRSPWRCRRLVPSSCSPGPRGRTPGCRPPAGGARAALRRTARASAMAGYVPPAQIGVDMPAAPPVAQQPVLRKSWRGGLFDCFGARPAGAALGGTPQLPDGPDCAPLRHAGDCSANDFGSCCLVFWVPFIAFGCAAARGSARRRATRRAPAPGAVAVSPPERAAPAPARRT
jgi:hypothetical protein